jgi:molybdopterin synthase catalytic subunit
MSVSIEIVDGFIAPDRVRPAAASSAFPGAGAIIEFRGIVRPLEASEPIEALEYEVYQPMAQRELERIARAVAARHNLLGVRLWHSRGRVEAGACSLWVVIAAERRKAAIAAVDELVDELKREVPIWKRACATAGIAGASHEESGRR